jgi:hypothetical protein
MDYQNFIYENFILTNNFFGLQIEIDNLILNNSSFPIHNLYLLNKIIVLIYFKLPNFLLLHIQNILFEKFKRIYFFFFHNNTQNQFIIYHIVKFWEPFFPFHLIQTFYHFVHFHSFNFNAKGLKALSFNDPFATKFFIHQLNH